MSNNLVYIHGFSADKADHPQLEKHLKNIGYKLYSFDLPAHGTLKNEYEINNITLDKLVEFCVSKIKAFNLDSFVLFGHSMGGCIASIISGQQRFKNELKGLILEAPHNKTVVLRSVSSIKAAVGLIKGSSKKNDAPKETGGLKESWGALKEYAKHLYEEKKEYIPLLKNILSFSSLNIIQDGIENIKVPTLLILGSKDVYIPLNDTIENYSNYLDNLEIHIIDGAGHCVSVDKPHEFYHYFNNFISSLTFKNE